MSAQLGFSTEQIIQPNQPPEKYFVSNCSTQKLAGIMDQGTFDENRFNVFVWGTLPYLGIKAINYTSEGISCQAETTGEGLSKAALDYAISSVAAVKVAKTELVNLWEKIKGEAPPESDTYDTTRSQVVEAVKNNSYLVNLTKGRENVVYRIVYAEQVIFEKDYRSLIDQLTGAGTKVVFVASSDMNLGDLDFLKSLIH